MWFCSRVREQSVSLYLNWNLNGARARFQDGGFKPSIRGGGAWCVWTVGRKQRSPVPYCRRAVEFSRAGPVWSVTGLVEEAVEFRSLDVVNKHRAVWSRGVMACDFPSIEGLTREKGRKEGINTYCRAENIQTMPRHSVLYPFLRAFAGMDLRKNEVVGRTQVWVPQPWRHFKGQTLPS